MALRDHEEGGAEGYFASVSDLMVGILFVFLLMLTVFALNYRVAEHDQEVSRARFDFEKARADRVRELLEQAAAQLQQDIAASSTARDRLLATLETTLSQRGIQVWVDRQAGILHLPGDLLFDTLSAALGPRQRDSVGIVANALARMLKQPGTKAPAQPAPSLAYIIAEARSTPAPRRKRVDVADDDREPPA